VLQCVTVYCSVLQCVAVCCSVMQFDAVCCSMLQSAWRVRSLLRMCSCCVEKNSCSALEGQELLFTSVCVYTYTQTHINISTPTHPQPHPHPHPHSFSLTHVHTHRHTHTHVQAGDVGNTFVYLYTPPRTHPTTHTCTHTCTHLFLLSQTHRAIGKREEVTGERLQFQEFFVPFETAD